MSFLKLVTDKEGLEKKAGWALAEFLNKNKNSEILLLLSGGSAFGILDFVDIENPGGLTVGVLDERFSKDSKVNNFSQLMETGFFKRFFKKGVTFIDTRVGEKDSFPVAKAKFESTLLNWRKNNPKGKLVVTMGIGEDGHTAGIMPFPESKGVFESLFKDKDSWVVGYDAGKKNPYPLRITVTLSFLKNAVDKAIVFVSGENKKKALEKVLADEGVLHETPGRVIKGMKEVVLFTDLDVEN